MIGGAFALARVVTNIEIHRAPVGSAIVPQQIITGAIGLDAWEWGVTLFAQDPLEFKKLVTDMRFDEVSARYAEFGDFYVGRIIS